MRSTLRLCAILLGLCAAAQAQSPHIGFGLNLILPTGSFREQRYGVRGEKEGYDLGLGGQFTLSFPVDQHLAIRLNLAGATTDGSNTIPDQTTLNLRHNQFNLGGELQVFFDSAYRHKGAYLFGGISADFERFDSSFGDPGYDRTDYTRKSRLGGVLGIGHSFNREGGARWTLEAAYHQTLTQRDVAAQNRPTTDYVRLGIGFVF